MENCSGLITLEHKATALADNLRAAQSENENACAIPIYNETYQSLGLCRKALELLQKHEVIADEVGDRSDEESTCHNLGNCYESP